MKQLSSRLATAIVEELELFFYNTSTLFLGHLEMKEMYLVLCTQALSASVTHLDSLDSFDSLDSIVASPSSHL